MSDEFNKRQRLIDLQSCIQNIKNCVLDSVWNFSAIGFHLKKIKEEELYKEAGWNGFGDYVKTEFGFSNSATTRYMQINDRFSVGGNSLELAPEYSSFNKSQLQEMLYLTNEQIEQVQSDMTVKEIRKLRALVEPVEPAPEKVEAIVASMMQAPVDDIPGQVCIEELEDGKYMPDEVVNQEDGLSCIPGCQETCLEEQPLKEMTVSENDKLQVLEEEIHLRESALKEMQDYWKEHQPMTLLKYQMICKACELMIEWIKSGKEGKNC